MAQHLLPRERMKPQSALLHADLTQKVIGGFYATYNELGPGFPEFVCRSALALTLTDAGLSVTEEALVPVWYRGRPLVKFRVDLLVEGLLLVEVKAVQQFERWHFSQVRHYLKATNLSLGLLVNFGPQPIFKRVVFETARTVHLSSSTGPVELTDQQVSQAPLQEAGEENGDVARFDTMPEWPPRGGRP